MPMPATMRAAPPSRDGPALTCFMPTQPKWSSATEVSRLAVIRRPLKAPPPLSWSWSGLYVGGHVGAAAGTTDFATLKQAMVYGTAVASLTVEAFSTDRLAKAGCREIRARRKELLKLIKA